MIGAELIAELQRSRPQALDLARLASPAAMIEPQLLRQLRLRLLPTADVGAEADLWFSGVVASRGLDSLVLDREAAGLLRAQLREKPELLDRVLDVIEAAHRHLPETLRIEERLIGVVLRGELGQIEALLRPLVRKLYAGGEAARSIAHWALRALPQAAPEVRAAEAAQALALLALTYVGRRRLLPEDRRVAATLGRIAWALPPALMESRGEVGVELLAVGLRFTPPITDALSLPKTTPMLVEAIWQEAGEERHVVLEAAPGKQYDLWTEPHSVTLRTLAGEEYSLSPVAGAGPAPAPAPSPKPVCCVVMGRGVVLDVFTRRTVDLQESYEKIVRPAVEAAGFECLQIDSGTANFISGVGVLYSAEAAVFDLSDAEPENLIRLGIRFALRPRTTVVMVENRFSLFSARVSGFGLTYEYAGSGIDEKEALRARSALTNLLAPNDAEVSPVYLALPELSPLASETRDVAEPSEPRQSEREPVCLVIQEPFDSARPSELTDVIHYEGVIEPAAIGAGCRCIRATDLLTEDPSRRLFYSAIINAEVVVLDLAAGDPGRAFYWGLCNALRPNGTVLLSVLKPGPLFDMIESDLFLSYADSRDEPGRLRSELQSIIARARRSEHEQNMLYKALPQLRPPRRDRVAQPWLDYLSRLDQPNEAAERLTAVAKTLSPRFPEIVVDAALRTQAKRSIPASVMLAMWALESAFGKAVPPQSNNPFGLKARPGEDFVTAPAVEAGEARASGVEARIRSGVEARFRRFATLDEAFDTVGQLLNGPAYAAARERLPDVRGFVSGLDRWAASPNYSKLLLRIMTEDNLFRLDAVAAQTSNPPPHA